MDNDLELDGMDMGAALSDISSDLGFPSGASGDPSLNEPPAGSPGPAATPPAVSSTPASATGAPPAAAPSAAPASQPWEGLPKAWKKEMDSHWASLPQEVRQYVHTREQQALEGIMHYKSHHDRFSEAYAPVKDYYTRANLDPITAFSNLAQADIALRHAPEDVKIQYLQALVNDYGLKDLIPKVFGTPAAPGGAPAGPNPEIQALQQQLRELQSKQSNWEQRQETAAIEENVKVLDAFCNDPKNQYANEVLDDILVLMKSGQASDLADAYGKAIYINPTVRQKIIDEQIAAITKTPNNPPRQPRSSNTPPASTAPKAGSIDDTLNDTYDKIVGS